MGGAVSFNTKIWIKGTLDEKVSLTSNNAKAAGKGLLKGLGKAKADAETNQSEKNYSKEELAAEMSFAGHDPVTPKLEYLQNDPTVRNLIEMRMSQVITEEIR